MKKNIKFILFSLIFALICPIVFFACGEVLFDDVPYTSTEADIEDIRTAFNDSCRYMVNENNLKTKFETTNTYTFYNTQTSTAKTVKDVIITTLGRVNDTTSPILAIIDTTRYVNDVKMLNTVNTYARANLSENETPYCYTFVKDYSGEEETDDKDRIEYNSNIQTIVSFFNSTIYEIKQDEVSSIQEKEFEGVTYYKLSSGVTTLEAVNNRFVEEREDDTLINNPQLFKIMTKSSHDAAENFYYECAKNSSNYASYFKIHYDLKNNERETYLNVKSVTKLIAYGESVELDLPDDVNEYTANSFMKTMQKDRNFITYTTTEQNRDDNSNPESNARITWTVVKLGNDYSVRRDEYQVGAPVNTTLYYLVNSNEDNYITYMANGDKLTRIDTTLELLNFNFNQTLSSKNENVYQFGIDQKSVIVVFNGSNVYSATTYNERNETLNIYIEDYGDDLSKLSLTYIESIDDYIIEG